MNVVEKMIERDPNLSVIQMAHGSEYHEFLQADLPNSDGTNPSGISVEEGEFVYGLVRLLKPRAIFETGTNFGISTRFMAHALEDNDQGGKIVTVEHDATVAGIAQRKFEKYSNIELICGKVENVKVRPDQIDMMWLDTELEYRYDELLRYLHGLKDRGIVCIHDLARLGMPEFKGVPGLMDDMLRNNTLRAIMFDTTHGLSIFQKDGGYEYPTR